MSVPTKSTYLPAIDGLRAVAILLVLYGHLSFGSLPRIMRATTLGQLGVTIFFTISGFLITAQLTNEQRASGRIDLRTFFLRRIFRLMPAFLALIGAACLLSTLGLAQLTRSDLLHALTYTMDYYQPRFPTLQHLWSLSVEEQFYLVWPLVILTLSRKNAGRVALACLFVCPLLRLIGWHFEWPVLFRRFEMNADALAGGCVVSLYRYRLHKIPTFLHSSLTVVAAFVILFVCAYLTKLLPVFPVIGISIETLSAMLLVHALSIQNKSPFARLLSLTPFVWVGTVSYSLYLWQQLFLRPTYFKALDPLKFGLVAAFATAVLSFYLVEKPIRDWGKRILGKKSQSFVPALISV